MYGRTRRRHTTVSVTRGVGLLTKPSADICWLVWEERPYTQAFGGAYGLPGLGRPENGLEPGLINFSTDPKPIDEAAGEAFPRRCIF